MNATSLEIRGLPADREFRVRVRAATRGTVENGVDFSSWYATSAGPWSAPVVARTHANTDNNVRLSLAFPDGSLVKTVKEGEQVDYRVRIAGINNTAGLNNPLAGVATENSRFGPRGATWFYRRGARGIVKRDLVWESATTAHVERTVTVPGGGYAQSPLSVDLLRDFSGDTGDQFSFRDDVLQSLCIEVTDSSGKLAAGGSCTTHVCSRTSAVQNAIVAAISGVTECAKVNSDNLKTIRTLTIPASALSTSGLKTEDFDGLTGLTRLTLVGTGLTALPDGVFDKLTELTILSLEDSALKVLPAGIFDKLTKLTSLNLAGNALPVLSPDVFDEAHGADRAWNCHDNRPDGPASRCLRRSSRR